MNSKTNTTQLINKLVNLENNLRKLKVDNVKEPIDSDALSIESILINSNILEITFGTFAGIVIGTSLKEITYSILQPVISILLLRIIGSNNFLFDIPVDLGKIVTDIIYIIIVCIIIYIIVVYVFGKYTKKIITENKEREINNEKYLLYQILYSKQILDKINKVIL